MTNYEAKQKAAKAKARKIKAQQTKRRNAKTNKARSQRQREIEINAAMKRANNKQAPKPAPTQSAKGESVESREDWIYSITPKEMGTSKETSREYDPKPREMEVHNPRRSHNAKFTKVVKY